MKKELLISVLLGIVGVGAIGYVLLQKPSSGTSIPNQENKTLTVTDVAKHAQESDCWVIVEDKAYDVTSLIDTHSGGARTIIPSCGGDVTSAFATKNRNEPHSEMAKEDLQSMYIGDIQ